MKSRPEYTSLPFNARRIVDYIARARESSDLGCIEGQRKIAKRLNLRRETVCRLMGRAVRSGVLVVEKRKRPNGSDTTNAYRLNDALIVTSAPKAGAAPRRYAKPSVERDNQYLPTVTTGRTLGDIAREQGVEI